MNILSCVLQDFRTAEVLIISHAVCSVFKYWPFYLYIYSIYVVSAALENLAGQISESDPRFWFEFKSLYTFSKSVLTLMKKHE